MLTGLCVWIEYRILTVLLSITTTIASLNVSNRAFFHLDWLLEKMKTASLVATQVLIHYIANIIIYYSIIQIKSSLLNSVDTTCDLYDVSRFSETISFDSQY